MKKKIIAVIMACIMLVGTLPLAASAATNTTSLATIQNIVGALGIISGDENGNLNLSSNVSRAQFAKIVVAASTYKDAAENNSTSSMFRDMSYSHWAAGYVKIAAQHGWVYGYLDGTFRPDNTITYQETVSVVLKLLGYTTDDYTGSYPEGPLLFADELGLSKNIERKGTDAMTRLDCMYLIYNVLNTKNNAGAIYCTTLGYSVNSSNEVDYSSVIDNALDGPVVVKDSSWTSEIPFDVTSARIYRNDMLSSFSSIATYDAVYYSESLKTLWVYNDRVTGIIESISPNRIAPTSVTVSGNTYSLDSTAAYELSTYGDFKIGSSVTLVMGKDNNVVTAMSTATITKPVYGVVVATGVKSYTDANKNSYSDHYMTMAATDGTTYQYTCSDVIEVGDLVSVTFSGDTTTVAEITDQKTVYGTVNADGTKLGSYYFAENVQILDVADSSYVTVLPSRIENVILKSDNIRYVSLNSAGQITSMILDDVTGDMKNYGILTEISNPSGGTLSKGALLTSDEEFRSLASSAISYSIALSGNYTEISGASKKFVNANLGPVAITGSGSSTTNMVSLTAVDLSSINELTAVGSSKNYTVYSGLQVYEKRGDDYYLASLGLVQDTSKYSLVGYYDKDENRGGRLRVVVATAK